MTNIICLFHSGVILISNLVMLECQIKYLKQKTDG